MLNDRLAVAQNVASHLMPTEEYIEDAIVSASKLTIAIVEGRKQARLPITTGQDSLAELARAAEALIEARSRIGAAHAHLAQDKVNIGLGTRAMGDWGECPKVAELQPDAVPGLRVVA